jgi:hypothetical protein
MSQIEEKDMYISETVGSFLANISQISHPVPHECVIHSLRDLIEATMYGNLALFSRSLGLPKTTVWELVQGHFPPSLPFLLQLCYQFRLSLVQVLINDEPIKPGESHVSQEEARKHEVRRPFDREKVLQTLENILADKQSISLSMREVARRLGYPVRTIKQYFPIHCREIACRYANYRKQQGQLRKAQLRQRIYEAAHIVHGQKLTPTYQRVGTVLNTPGCFREYEARCALRDVRAQLEGEMERCDRHS